MQIPVRLALIVIVLAGCVGCDQLSKAAARACLPEAEVRSLLGDAVRLQRVENPGAFLSLGDSLPRPVRATLFTFAVAALVAGLLCWAALGSALRVPQRAAIAAIAAGGLGNLIDRIRFDGLVTDFLNVGIGPVRTGIFNVADVVLMVGVLLLLTAGSARPPPADGTDGRDG